MWVNVNSQIDYIWKKFQKMNLDLGPNLMTCFITTSFKVLHAIYDEAQGCNISKTWLGFHGNLSISNFKICFNNFQVFKSFSVWIFSKPLHFIKLFQGFLVK